MTDPAPLPRSLVLIGAGKMGGAMLAGWLGRGLAPDAVTIVDPRPSPEIAALCEARAIALNPPPDAIDPPEVLVLATKPQGLDEAAGTVAACVGPGTLIVSILAGKTVGDILARVPGAAAVVRAMPNLPASIGRGATGAFASPAVTPAQRTTAAALLGTVGLVAWIDDEALIDAVTAVSGSGPAYVFLLAECLAEAGRAAGLPADLATKLARATVAGAGALLDSAPLPAAELRRNVTSPGGTTAAALEVLMGEPGLQALMTQAVLAAKRRAEALSS